jgi:hypothetical protein
VSKVTARRAAVATLLAASLLAILVVVAACGSQTAEETATRPLLSTLDGKAVNLDEYKGKPVFLAFMEST